MWLSVGFRCLNVGNRSYFLLLVSVNLSLVPIAKCRFCYRCVGYCCFFLLLVYVGLSLEFVGLALVRVVCFICFSLGFVALSLLLVGLVLGFVGW